MGLSPLELDRMSLAQVLAATDGWRRSREPDGPPPPTDEEFEAIMGRYRR